MQILSLSVITALQYFIGAGIQYSRLTTGKTRIPQWSLHCLALVAILLHGYLLYSWIDGKAGQNLNAFNMLSLFIWVTAIIILLTSLIKPIEYLSIFIFPLASLSIILVILFPEQHIIQTANNPKQLIHIFLSVLAFSIITISGLQAILLAIQDHQLRDNRARGIIQQLPPLETSESLLFKMITIGFLLLSIVIVTSVYSFHRILKISFAQKISFVLLSWLILCILLIGRYYFGWRGRKAIRFTLCGVCFLAFAYFGNKLLIGH